jgi:peptidoglycan/LPS O-acetylase OafA/YrhL
MTIVGALLVVFGLVFLIEQLAGDRFGEEWWPLFIIGPGVALLAAGLILPQPGLIIGGSVVSTIGAVLYYQNVTGHWESWAYAWALVGPFASGVGSMVAGWRTDNQGMVRGGAGTATVGLILFAVGYLFFEQVLGISGRQTPIAEWVLPALLMVAGVILLVRAVSGWQKGAQSPHDPST